MLYMGHLIRNKEFIIIIIIKSISLIIDLKHNIFGLFLIFNSKLFHNETVDGIKDVIDILSLLLGVA